MDTIVPGAHMETDWDVPVTVTVINVSHPGVPFAINRPIVAITSAHLDVRKTMAVLIRGVRKCIEAATKSAEILKSNKFVVALLN